MPRFDFDVQTDEAARTGEIDARWARMTRPTMHKRDRHSDRYRRMMPRRGAGSASPGAPNGRGYGMGPTGQPSDVE